MVGYPGNTIHFLNYGYPQYIKKVISPRLPESFLNFKLNRYCVKSQPANSPFDTVFYFNLFQTFYIYRSHLSNKLAAM